MYSITIGRPCKNVWIDKDGTRTELWKYPGDWNRYKITVDCGCRIHQVIVDTWEEAQKMASFLNTAMCYGMANFYVSETLKEEGVDEDDAIAQLVR